MKRFLLVVIGVLGIQATTQAQFARLTSLSAFAQSGMSFVSYDNINARLSEQNIETLRTPLYQIGAGAYLTFESVWQIGVDFAGYISSKRGVNPEVRNQVFHTTLYNGYIFQAGDYFSVIPSLGFGFAWSRVRLVDIGDTLATSFNNYLTTNSGLHQQDILNRNFFIDGQVQAEFRPDPYSGFFVGLTTGYRLGISSEWKIADAEGATAAPEDPFAGFHLSLRIGWIFVAR